MRMLRQVESRPYKVLLTIVPPYPLPPAKSILAWMADADAGRKLLGGQSRPRFDCRLHIFRFPGRTRQVNPLISLGAPIAMAVALVIVGVVDWWIIPVALGVALVVYIVRAIVADRSKR